MDALDPEALRALAGRMIAAGAYLCPTLTVTEARRLAAAERAGDPAGDRDLRFLTGWAEAATRITQTMAAEGVDLLIGQDGFDPAGTVREMELLASVGVPPVDVLRAATLHGATWLSREEEAGSLEVGRRADLLVIREDPLRDIRTLRSPLLVVQRGMVRHRAGL